jgi:hypothetical protein
MKNTAVWATVWVLCGVATVVAGVLARRSPRWLFVGRVATGTLFIVGGALVHLTNLVGGGDYAEFADPAHFAWVTDTWRAVVPPNQTVLIGLLALFEATVGVLALMGGRKTQLGYIGVLAFYSALWLFGWFETIWVLAMIPPLLALLRAERRSQPEIRSRARAEVTPRTPVGV